MAYLIDQLQEFGAGVIDDLLMTIQTIGATSPLEAPADNLGLRRMRALSEIPKSEIVGGFTQFVVPFINFARVQIPNGQGVLRCDVGNLSQVPDHGELYEFSADMGSGVGVAMHKQPQPRAYSDEHWSDVISHGSGVGFYGQEVYRRFLTESVDRGGAIDFGNGQPIDQLPGDWGHTCDTGVGFHADQLMFYARVSETTGVFGFYIDNMLRVCGDSLEIESDAMIARSGDDEGELFHEVETYYTPWEAVGLLSPGNLQASIQENDPAKVAREGGQVWESTAADSLGFQRLVVYGGYLGQGFQSICYGMPDSETMSESVADDVVGLSRIFQAVGGQVLIESAKRITIAKSSPFYVPVRLKHRSSTDEEADSIENDNYRFSGYYGGGNEHVMGDATVTAQDPIGQLVGSVLHAASFYAADGCWAATHPFVYHENDFLVSDSARFTGTASPNTSTLSQSDHILPPPPIDFKVDHRYQEKLYKLLSLIQIEDDGSIVIQEAMGGSITLSGGVVTVSGTSVRVVGGKNTYIAGGRIAMRSAKDVDINASSGRVRIAAHRDLELLGANSGSGGILIENRGAGESQQFPADPDNIRVGGVVIKSANAPLQAITAGVYIRTGVAGSGVQSGPIILDANGGNDAIYQRANSHYRFTAASFVDCFGTSPSSISAINLYGPQNNIFTGALSTLGGVAAGDSIQAVGNIVATESVGKAAEPQRIVANINKLRESLNKGRTTTASNMTSQLIVRFESANRIGNQTTAAGVSFGFPEASRYGASQVKFTQPHWEKVLAASNPGLMQQWTENPVVYQPNGLAKPTHIWPGREVWEAENSWLGTDPAQGLYNQQTNNPLHPATNRENYESILSGDGLPLVPGSIKEKLKFIP